MLQLLSEQLYIPIHLIVSLMQPRSLRWAGRLVNAEGSSEVSTRKVTYIVNG
jgi:hypothetical protein